MNSMAGIPATKESLPQGTTAGRPSLFKDSVYLQDQVTGQSALENSLHAASSLIVKENWRSDSIINIFMDLWMTVPEREQSQLKNVQFVSFEKPTVAKY